MFETIMITSIRDVGNEHAHACCVSQRTVNICLKRYWRFWCFIPNLLEYVLANNYSTVKRFGKVIAEIRWCTFLPHRAEYNCACAMGI